MFKCLKHSYYPKKKALQADLLPNRQFFLSNLVKLFSLFVVLDSAEKTLKQK